MISSGSSMIAGRPLSPRWSWRATGAAALAPFTRLSVPPGRRSP